MRLVLPILLMLAAAGAAAPPPAPGKNGFLLGGQRQDIYVYPSAAGAHDSKGAVLFAPGDGGWRGFAITIAKTMAGWGYDVYGLDTKRYLESFTGQTHLAEADVISDFRAMAQWVRPSGGVLLAGWSEGAGLGLLAAAGPENRNLWRGFVAIGLPEASFLGWRSIDDLTYITKKDPNEPRFVSLPWLPKLAPVPFAMIHSDHDDFTSVAAAEKMFAAAAGPKKWWLISARNHRFDGGTERFFDALQGALAWLDSPTK